MSRSLMFAGALALLVGGCASSAETERRAEIHDTRARQAAAYENYDRAAQEKHEGDRLHSKAAQSAPTRPPVAKWSRLRLRRPTIHRRRRPSRFRSAERSAI